MADPISIVLDWRSGWLLACMNYFMSAFQNTAMKTVSRVSIIYLPLKVLLILYHISARSHQQFAVLTTLRYTFYSGDFSASDLLDHLVSQAVLANVVFHLYPKHRVLFSKDSIIQLLNKSEKGYSIDTCMILLPRLPIDSTSAPYKEYK